MNTETASVEISLDKKENIYSEKHRKFIRKISELSSGDLAILRRCNRNPHEDPRLFPVIGKLGVLNSYNHALIACLYAVYHKSYEEPIFEENYNFGKAFRNAYDPVPENKEQRNKYKPKQDTRFRSILTADHGDALTYRLRQAVRLIQSKNEPLDFSILLGDLFNWDNSKKRVQRKWAEGYYSGFASTDDANNADQSDDFDNDEETDEDDES